MQCEIQWNILSLEEWHARFATIARANLLQSYDYALAACAVNRQTARWGLIKIDGVEAGLVQMLEAKILGQIFHALIIDRGPLWFEGFGAPAHFTAFSAEINRQFPRRIGRARRYIPEAEGVCDIPGFKKTPVPPYQTIWLDLTKSEEELRAGLNSKWRNMLKKAEKSDLHVEWDDHGAFLPILISGYVDDKAAKGYDGPSVPLITALAKTLVPKRQMLIGHARPRGEGIDKICASILILCHGNSATYQIGWSDDTGRKTAAHYILLWQAMMALKNRQINHFDLGGVNEDTAKSVKSFKEKIGGTLTSLSGLYS